MVLSGGDRTKSGEYILEQGRQVDFISNHNSNWLGVAAQSVAMKKTEAMWQTLLKRHPIIHPIIHSPPLSSHVASWTLLSRADSLPFQPPAAFCFSDGGFSLVLQEPKDKAAWKYKDWILPWTTFIQWGMGVRWENTHASPSLCDVFSGRNSTSLRGCLTGWSPAAHVHRPFTDFSLCAGSFSSLPHLNFLESPFTPSALVIYLLLANKLCPIQLLKTTLNIYYLL